jgi:hypothetical protein
VRTPTALASSITLLTANAVTKTATTLGRSRRMRRYSPSPPLPGPPPLELKRGPTARSAGLWHGLGEGKRTVRVSYTLEAPVWSVWVRSG